MIAGRRALGAAALVVALEACGASHGTIGAVLAKDDDGRLFVRDVPAGLAADRAGVEPGDEVLLIDGRDARALGARGVHTALAGGVGEPVRLTLVRKGEILRVTLRRTEARKYALTAEKARP